MGFLRTYWRNDSGISSTEYAVLTAVVAVGVVLAIGQLSGATTDTMVYVTDCLKDSLPTNAC